MADHLEPRGYILQLFRDVLADQAKTTSAGGASARLAIPVMVIGVSLWLVHLALARQVGGQRAINLWRVRSTGCGRHDRRGALMQWCSFQESDLRGIQLLAWTIRSEP